MHKPTTKLNKIANYRKAGDASRKSVPKVSKMVTSRDEIGVKRSHPKRKANVRR